MQDHRYAVIDTETTGLFPGGHDRILEIAIVLLNGKGDKIDEYATLINPGRDVGPTHIHGITASDVRSAPQFKDLVSRKFFARGVKTYTRGAW